MSDGDPNRRTRAAGTILVVAAALVAAIGLFGLSVDLLAYGSSLNSGILEGLLGLAAICGIPAAIGAWLRRRAGPVPPEILAARGAAGRRPLSTLRLIFAVFGALIVLFAGGCSLFFLASIALDSGSRGMGGYVSPLLVAIVGGPPLAAGALVWWLAARVGRG